MKTPIRYPLALLTACAVLPAAGLFAQSPSPAMSATPSVSMPAGSGAATEEHEGGAMQAITKLTPEERQKLKAAHQAALQDPAVKSAEAGRDTDKAGKKAYREAVRAAMLKADPSVKPILEKIARGKARGASPQEGFLKTTLYIDCRATGPVAA